MNFKKLIAVFSIIFYNICNAQQGIPVYADYLTDNYYLIHPSMAGASNCSKVRLTARKQWFGNEKAPALQTLSYNGMIGEQSAMGVILFNDRNGFHSQKGVKATYAHHIQFSRSTVDLNQLSFGMSVGFQQYQLDETTFDLNDFDPIIAGIRQSDTYYNVDVGMSYNVFDFYAHLTVKNALFQKKDIYTEFESDNLRRYLISAGYTFGDSRKILWEPSVLFQVTDFTGEKSIDVNLKVYKQLEGSKIWGGVSYRRSFDGAQFLKGNQISSQKLQNITPILGINYKKWMVAYAYSQVVGDIKFDNGGFHNITLGFDFNCKKEKYDCNCPAVN